MLIKKLTLRNFRNFKDVKLNFSTDKDKKFTIIIGKNTYGKTTLVRSFVWCLYRINLFDDKILLNTDEQLSMSVDEIKTVSVTLELEHNNCLYRITTTEKYTKTSSGSVIVIDKAITKVLKADTINFVPIPDALVEVEIESILRSELKEYFFFEGEKNQIEKAMDNKNLKSAVYNILGLNKVKNLKDLFNATNKVTVPNVLNSEKTSSNPALLAELKAQQASALDRKRQLEDKNIQADIEITSLEKTLEEQEAILDANNEIKDLQDEKKELVAKISKDEVNKENYFSRLLEMTSTSNSLLKILFAKSYSLFDFEGIKNASSFKSGNSYKYISDKAVDDLIKRGRCICGALIKDGNDAYNHLLEAKQHMEPHDFGQHISDFTSGEASNVFIAKTQLENIKEQAVYVLDTIESIDDNEDKLKLIKDKIEGKPDIGEVQKFVDTLKRQINFQEGIIKNNNEIFIPQEIQIIDEIQKKIDLASDSSSHNDFINKCLVYAKEISRQVQAKLDESEVYLRDRLEEEVGKIFTEMFHDSLGERKVIIDNNFKVKTILSRSNKQLDLDGTGGSKTVLNYAFVCGLMKLARENILLETNPAIMGSVVTKDEYPLVMDAPFSNCDETHIRLICKALPKYCNQIIMFVMQKDFDHARKEIEEQIGTKYDIIQYSQTNCDIEGE